MNHSYLEKEKIVYPMLNNITSCLSFKDGLPYGLPVILV